MDTADLDTLKNSNPGKFSRQADELRMRLAG